jgi:diguanylate cyclase (GGDEF)-like protein
MREFAPTWLCPDLEARERLLEVDERLRPAQLPFWAAMSIALLAFIPRYGLWPLLPLVAATIVGGPVRSALVPRVPPEYVIAGVAVFSQVMLGIGIGFTGGAASPALPVMLVAATLIPARFSGRGMWVLLGIALACMVVPALVADPASLAAHPELLVACVCGMLGMAPLVATLTGSDRQHRSAAAHDALTGLPNRRSLESRFAALVRAAQARGAQVALLTCDIDHFKAVNDTHGHVRGDRVLQAFAGVLASTVRDGDCVCRWGGEEFVVATLVPNEPAGRQAAERLRRRVAEVGFDDLPLTVSIGLAVVEPGEALQEAFDRADAALYRAKALGRNRVVVDGDELASDLISLPA